MKRNPIWLVVILYGSLGAVLFSLPLFTSFNKVQLNLPFFCWLGLIGYASIVAYSIFKVNRELNQTFEKLSDKEKLVDLLEDQLEIKKYAEYCAYKAEKNIEKIEVFSKDHK